MLKPIELFLLSQMRSKEKVDAVLSRAGVTRAEMARATSDLVRRYGVGETRHSADVYDELIGRPTSESILTDVPIVFAGSVSRRYTLSTWPEVPFVVNRDRNGLAWGWGFQREVASDADFRPEVVAPWEWASNGLKGRADEVSILDWWSTDEDLVLRFGRSRYRGQFDWGLLQTWTRVD